MRLRGRLESKLGLPWSGGSSGGGSGGGGLGNASNVTPFSASNVADITVGASNTLLARINITAAAGDSLAVSGCATFSNVSEGGSVGANLTLTLLLDGLAISVIYRDNYGAGEPNEEMAAVARAIALTAGAHTVDLVGTSDAGGTNTSVASGNAGIVAVQMTAASGGGGGGGGGVGGTTLTANFAQPSLASGSNTVVAHVASTTGMLVGGFLVVQGGGQYLITATGAGTVTLQNIGGPSNVVAGTNVPSGNAVIFGASSPFVVLGGYSPASVLPRVNVLDPQWGVVGDGVANDHAGIVAASALALSLGVPLFFPATRPNGSQAIYGVSTELTIQAPVTWIGDAVSMTRGPILRALAPMRSVVSVESTFGAGAVNNPPSARFEGLIIDANQQTGTDGLLRIGDYGSNYERVYCLNSPRRGFSAAGRPLPLLIGAVTAGGGAPAGQLTVTQPTPNTGFGMQLEAGLFTFVAKFVDATHFVLSQDGGVTFGTFQQTAGANVNLMISSGGASAIAPSGIQLHFGAGPFANGNTYSIPVTVQTADAGTTAALNTGARFTHCGTQQNGTVYCTNTLSPNFAAYNLVVKAGTVSIASGSQVVTLTGDTFPLDIREGDMIQVAGVAYPLAGVGDATTAYIAHGAEPTVTLAGQDWAIKTGGGWWEDPATENNTSEHLSLRSANDVVSVRVGGLHGVTCVQGNFAVGAMGISILVGSSQQQLEECAFIRTDLESTATAYVHPNVGAGLGHGGGVDFFGFCHLSPLPLGAGQWTVYNQGNIIQANGPASVIGINTLSYSEVTVTLAGAGATIPAPDLGRQYGGGSTSVVNVQATAAVTLTSTPTMPQPTGNIPVLRKIKNTGNFPLTLLDDIFFGTGLRLAAPYVTLGSGDTVEFISHGGKWWQQGVSIVAVNVAGSTGQGTRAFAKTTAVGTVLSLWDLDVAAGALMPGTMFVGDVLAQSRNGEDVAFWHDVVCMWKADARADANFLQASIPNAAPNYAAANNGTAWTLTVTNDVGGFNGHLNFTGDGSTNTIYITIIGRQWSPPVSF